MPPPNDTPIDRAVAAYLRAKPHLSMQQALRFAGHVASDTSPLSTQEVMHNAASNDDRTQYINPREELVANGEGPLTTVIRRSPSPSERASRYWVDAIRNNHKYANGKIGTRRELLGRRLLASAVRQRGPLHSDAEALLKGFEQGREGVEAPLLDALQEHHPEAHELLARPATPDNPGRLQRRADAFKYTRNTMKYFRD